MEAQAALVGTERGVELDTEAAVDLDVAVVVNPRNAEDQLAFRFAQTLDETVVGVVRVFVQDNFEGVEYFCNGLVKFGLASVALQQHVVVAGHLFINGHVIFPISSHTHRDVPACG